MNEQGHGRLPHLGTEACGSFLNVSNEQNGGRRLRGSIRSLSLVISLIPVVSFLFPSPRFNGPTNVITYSESSFRSIVMDDPTNTNYIVMFDAKWATGIEYVKAIFADLSLQYPICSSSPFRYTTDTTVFLHVDLSTCRTLAHDLSINVDGYAGEIPVFISFRKVQSCY